MVSASPAPLAPTLRPRVSHSSYRRAIWESKLTVKDWLGLRRAYSQRRIAASRTCRASEGVGTAPAELLILAIPVMPTKEYGWYIGGRPPNTGPTICPPTVKLEPGEEWSLPPASKSTPSKAQRI